MRNCIFVCAALALAGVATDAAARTQVLEPTSDWTVDYGDEKCSLLRDFGPLDDGIGLRIESYGSLSSFQMSLIGDLIPRPTLEVPVTLVRFAWPTDDESREISALTGTIGDHRFVQFGMSFVPFQPNVPRLERARNVDQETISEAATSRAPDAQFEATVTSLRIEVRRGQELQLNTGSMAPALRAACRVSGR